MSVSGSLTVQQVSELVQSNRVIRAPFYEKDVEEGVRFTDPDKGLQWGADVIPALLGLFRVDSRNDHPDGWVGFARHWRGGTIRVEFELFSGPPERPPIVVVTAIAGRAGSETNVADAVGDVDPTERIPTREDWEQRYSATRRKDGSDGWTAVAAFIAALPGWKGTVATRFDGIVRSEVTEVRRAVKWHQPFYGVEDRGWFASFGAFSKHVKLTFVCGSPLEPRPPDGTGTNGQALDVTETDTLDEEQVASWVREAADDPGMNW